MTAQLKLLDAIDIVVVVDDDAGAFGLILILDVLPSAQCPHWCFERGNVQQIEDHPSKNVSYGIKGRGSYAIFWVRMPHFL